jgi:hypothetical protein
MLKTILLAGAAAFAASQPAQTVVDDITPAKAGTGGIQADAQVTTTDRQAPATAPAAGTGLRTATCAQLGAQVPVGEEADPPHQMQQPHQQLPAPATGTAQVPHGQSGPTGVPAGTGAAGTVQSGAVGMTGPTGHAGQSGVTGARHGAPAAAEAACDDEKVRTSREKSRRSLRR